MRLCPFRPVRFPGVDRNQANSSTPLQHSGYKCEAWGRGAGASSAQPFPVPGVLDPICFPVDFLFQQRKTLTESLHNLIAIELPTLLTAVTKYLIGSDLREEGLLWLTV